MALAARLLLLLIVIGVLVVTARNLLAARPTVKCATCRHCRKLFDDGTLCGFGSRETFKNAVHVDNCMDYRKA